MSAAACMKDLGWWFGFHWWWAERRTFVNPGLYVWTGNQNFRVLPTRRYRPPPNN